MRLGLNFLNRGLALTACLGLISACADRGAFKSKKYNALPSDSTIQDKDKPIVPTKTNPAPTGQAPITPGGAPSTATPGAGGTTPPAPAPGAGPAQPVNPTPDIQTATAAIVGNGALVVGAQGQHYNEFQSKRDLLINQNKLQLDQGVSALAAKIIKGISIVPTGLQGNLVIEILSLFEIETKRYHLKVKNAPLRFQKEGNVEPLPAEVTDLMGAPSEVAKLVNVTAICTVDEKCSEIQVSLTFKMGQGITPAVFLLKSVGPNYAIVQNNIALPGVELPSYIAAVGIFGTPSVTDVVQPQPPVTTPPTVSPAPGAPPPVAPTPSAPPALSKEDEADILRRQQEFDAPTGSQGVAPPPKGETATPSAPTPPAGGAGPSTPAGFVSSLEPVPLPVSTETTNSVPAALSKEDQADILRRQQEFDAPAGSQGTAQPTKDTSSPSPQENLRRQQEWDAQGGSPSTSPKGAGSTPAKSRVSTFFDWVKSKIPDFSSTSTPASPDKSEPITPGSADFNERGGN